MASILFTHFVPFVLFVFFPLGSRGKRKLDFDDEPAVNGIGGAYSSAVHSDRALCDGETKAGAIVTGWGYGNAAKREKDFREHRLRHTGTMVAHTQDGFIT